MARCGSLARKADGRKAAGRIRRLGRKALKQVLERLLAPVDQEDRRPLGDAGGRLRQRIAAALGDRAADALDPMPGGVLVPDPQQVAGEQLVLRGQKGLPGRTLHAPNQKTGAGLLGRIQRVLGPLRQKVVVRPRSAERAGEIVQRILLRLRVAGVVPQQAVAGDHVVDVVRALLAPLDLPGPDLGDPHQHLDQDVHAQVEAGKQAPAVALLGVDAAAGLDAAPAQPAAPPQEAAPVAAARHPVAERPVNEGLQIQGGRAGLGHRLHLVHRELARQHDAVDRELFGHELQRRREAHVGKRRPVHLAGEPRLPHESRHRQVLHDDRIRPHVAGELVQDPPDRVQLVRLDQGVEGDVDPRAFAVRERGEGSQLLEGEVLGLHAR